MHPLQGCPTADWGSCFLLGKMEVTDSAYAGQPSCNTWVALQSVSLFLSLLSHQTPIENDYLWIQYWVFSFGLSSRFPVMYHFSSGFIIVHFPPPHLFCTFHQHTGEQMESRSCSLRTSRLGSPWQFSGWDSASNAGALVRSLVWELRSHMPQGPVRKKRTNRLSLEGSFVCLFVFERKNPSPFLMDTVYLRCNCHITLC